MMNSKERFTSRVDAYRRFRPHYPAALLAELRQECGLTRSSVIADIGAGTGILAELFLQSGYSVMAVEPNAAMRAACEELQATYPNLECIDGSAEATGLSGQCADFVTAGQAMHWFDRKLARQEFMRILRPAGYAVIATNQRRTEPQLFLIAYEQFLRDYGTDYEYVKTTNLSAPEMAEFFAPAKMSASVFQNDQTLDFEGLLGRVLSSSYMPQPGHPRYAAMYSALMQLFERHKEQGVVRLIYDCRVSYARLT